jgi:hypothetical protein
MFIKPSPQDKRHAADITTRLNQYVRTHPQRTFSFFTTGGCTILEQKAVEAKPVSFTNTSALGWYWNLLSPS